MVTRSGSVVLAKNPRIQFGNSAFSRTDQGYPAASHTSVRIASACLPYRQPRGRAALSFGFPGGAPFSSRIAYFR